MSEWGDCTFLAWEKQRGRCQICRKRIYLNDDSKEMRMVGHHERNRKDGGTDAATNCIARHQICETWAHKVAKDGNPKPYQIKRYRQYGE